MAAVPEVMPFFDPASHTWSYLVADPETRCALVIDPVLDFDAASGRTGTASAEALLAAVDGQGLKLDWVLETHAHADHLSAGHWLRRQRHGLRIGIGEGIRTVQATFRDIFHLGSAFPVDGSQFDRLFRDGDSFALGRIQVQVIATPGHTSDSVSYLIGNSLFTGDSLFMPDAGTARCDFPGGDAAVLYQSIQRLYELPDETLVYVCHDYGPNGRAMACKTTIGDQKAANIHVRPDTDEDSFILRRTTRDQTLAMPALMLPAVQVNIRAGALPAPESDGHRYLKLPLDRF